MRDMRHRLSLFPRSIILKRENMEGGAVGEGDSFWARKIKYPKRAVMATTLKAREANLPCDGAAQ